MSRTCLLIVLMSTVACGNAPGSGADTAYEATGSSAATNNATTTELPTTGDTTATPGSGSDDTTTHGEPVCCGCLCVDPRWSCAANTCLNAGGTVETLAPEAGFLGIGPHNFSTFEGGLETVHAAPEARIWYAFRPADIDPQSRPLAVFFNGGPGYSSATLFGINTNAVTLDPDIAGDAVVADNPHSWTRFANVLYIDPRNAGYSYEVAPDVSAPPPLLFTPEHDAADFVRVILAFLTRHPQIRSNAVMLVGESYGGNRSALMLGQVLYPGRLAQSSRYHDPALRDELLAHYAVVFPAETMASNLTPRVLAGQFGHQVLIQPAITWLSVPDVPVTPDDQQMIDLGCVADPDHLQCDEENLWSYTRTSAVVNALTDPSDLALALGVDPTTIAWMYADARVGALPRGPSGSKHDESSLRAVFGELPAGESYYDPANVPNPSNYTFNWQDKFYGKSFLESFFNARTFITDAGKDLTVYSPDISAKIAGYTDAIASVIHDVQPVADEARPGRLVLKYAPGVIPGDPEVVIRHPYYSVGGHIVGLKMGGELADDVCRWFSADCPLP